ncbi:MAG: pyridoxal phosphate-dependent decarboxylase family protein [Actinomycetales bacterium]
MHAQYTADEVAAALPGQLPEHPSQAVEVIRLLLRAAEPGLVGTGAGRFFGWVTGGVLPAALAADWLTSTWDQNAMLRASSPAAAGVETVAARWLVDLLGLPSGSGVGFVTGATMANFTCLATARDTLLTARGWDVARDGLTGAPRIRVIAGAEVHDSVPLALRYLGLGEPERVAADPQGRIDLTQLRRALARCERAEPTIVCLQAGNVHSGAFDLFSEAIEAARAVGAWVHVDGAFGLWAAASPRLAHLVDGVAQADSWASDAHKTLNVPHDCGLAIVADPSRLHAAMGMQGAYLIRDGGVDPLTTVPELSRRARGFSVWAALAQLGRRGVAQLVETFADHAATFAARVQRIDGLHVLNDVDFTQVCLAAEDDAATGRVAAELNAQARVWITPSRWQGRMVLRVSMSTWRTTGEDLEEAVDALRAAAERSRRADGEWETTDPSAESARTCAEAPRARQ